MVLTKPALDADEAAQSEIDVVLDDVGPALIVDGQRKATSAARLRYVARRAAAIAAALEGAVDDSEGDGDHNDIEPFRPIWPGRLPVESGVPAALVADARLTGTQRFVWFGLWLLVPHITGRLEVRERVSWVARWLGLDVETVRKAIKRFADLGWATVSWRAPPPSAYGEFRAQLHLRPRPDAPGAVVETTAAEPKGDR